MSGFTALNVEPEEYLEEEVDDTKEIQLEEAFKLYQNALRLHSQGPAYLKEAGQAYDELFNSEVFKYPEALSEYLQEASEDVAVTVAPVPENTILSVLTSSAAEAAANSVPQLAYLSYKSRGQYVLDLARADAPASFAFRAEACQHYAESCRLGLKDFANALERDDTDIDLWKKAARVADVLKTYRIARFCLESVIAGDDDASDDTIDLSGLDEILAADDLKDLIGKLLDDLSAATVSDVAPRHHLISSLRKTNDAYPFLPPRMESLSYNDDVHSPQRLKTSQHVIHLAKSTSEALTVMLSAAVADVTVKSDQMLSSTAIKIELIGHDTGVQAEAEVNKSVQSNTSTPQGNNNHSVIIDTPEKSPAYADALSEQPPEEASLGPIETRTEEKEGQQTDLEVVVDENGIMDTLHDERGMNLPTRKRSSTAAGNEEPEGRKQSKRLRARESMVEAAALEEETSHEPQQFHEEQLAEYHQTDQEVFLHVSASLEMLKLGNLNGHRQLRQEFWGEEVDGSDRLHIDAVALRLSLSDLKSALSNWSDPKTQAFVHGHGIQDYVEKSIGMTLLSQHSKSAAIKHPGISTEQGDIRLLPFITSINQRSCDITTTSLAWLELLLTTNRKGTNPTAPSSYLDDHWSEEMKEAIMSIMEVNHDSYVQILQQRYLMLDKEVVNANQTISQQMANQSLYLFEFLQGIFELYLDRYVVITGPSSEAETASRITCIDMLKRWASLTNDVMQLYLATHQDANLDDKLVLRHLWATSLFATQADGVDKRHTVLCLQDLSAIMRNSGTEVMPLPNNSTMFEISATALDHEISRLNTLDFFMSVFDSDNSDPTALVEKLEPLLELASMDSAKSTSEKPDHESVDEIHKLVEFLDSGDASLKLFLWKRLQNAYTAISYSPKVISCLLRAIETIADELQSDRHLELEQSHRQIAMLKWLRDADELLVKVLVKITNEENPFECIDESHIRSTSRAVTFLTQILYGFQIYDDSIRVGQIPPPQLKGVLAMKTFEKNKDRFREMLVRLWTLQYTLLKEAFVQIPIDHPGIADYLANILQAVHHMLGVRHYCKQANKIFIRLVKSELAVLETTKDYAADIAQVYYDLYNLRFSPGKGDQDHGCPNETLDKKTAISLIPSLMTHVSGLGLKDLAKNEIKATIDRIQSASGAVKSSGSNLTYNKKLISAFLKSPINPEDIFRCVRGLGDLPVKLVTADTKVIADCGWYYLMGLLTLNKYRAIKRVNPTPTDDLDVAAQFLRQDLEHDIEKWETWYRLAQVFECKIEDDLIWNSTKINDNRPDIAQLERSAIHAYTMAIAVAMRSAEDDKDTTKKIHDMFAEFATRLYSSSRPPLDMEAFRTDKHIRHLSNSYTGTMSKTPFYDPIQLYSLWNFAAYLLRQNIGNHPRSWLRLYTLGKCLWKMFQHPDNAKARKPVTTDNILDALTEAIDALPRKEKSSEYILEPHFKISSIVHKMVQRKDLTPHQAVGHLAVTRYAQGVHLSEDDSEAEWEPYILSILAKLGHADKSNWHHRIGARAAHIIWDGDPRSLSAALGAKHEFTQQIFTKTMTLQVWKPEFERPGRHYVYTGRYVLFFAQLLEMTGDRAGLDQLIRRIRRKPTDFLNHPKIWEEVITRYVQLLRKIGKFDEGRERTLFDPMNHEEFSKNADKLESWAHDPDTDSKVLGVMRDAVELKKLNNSLMKGSQIDDLIGDAYANLYETFVAQMTPEKQPTPPAIAMQHETALGKTGQKPHPEQDSTDRMRLGNFLAPESSSVAGENPSPQTLSIGLGVQTLQPQALPATVETNKTVTLSKPGRVKTVTRREIQRKAESALLKPPPIKTPILGKKPIIELSTGRKDSAFTVDDDVDNTETSNRRQRNIRAEGDDEHDSRQSSRQGSVHESADGEMEHEGDADDESELSEMDEGVELFEKSSARGRDRREDDASRFSRLGTKQSRTRASESSNASRERKDDDDDEREQTDHESGNDNGDDDEHGEGDTMEVDENEDGNEDEDEGEGDGGEGEGVDEEGDDIEVSFEGHEVDNDQHEDEEMGDSGGRAINRNENTPGAVEGDIEIPDSQGSPELTRKTEKNGVTSINGRNTRRKSSR